MLSEIFAVLAKLYQSILSY